MFAGINTVETAEENQLLTGMASKENEKVAFLENIRLSDYEKINFWLLKLEELMQESLAD